MRRCARSISVLVLCVAAISTAYAQQPQQPNAPLELPEFLVTGKETIDVGSGSKNTPRRPPLLSAARLDSLNPTEKLPVPTLPTRQLPRYTRSITTWPGYVDANIGNYLTPMVTAGYSFVVDGYRIDASGDIEASQGWTENAGYMTGGVRLQSTYVAPDKFLVLGGSTTVVDAAFRTRNYSLFADSLTPDRSHSTMTAGVAVDGSYDGTRYSASAMWTHQGVTTNDTRSVRDNGIRGTLRVEQQWTSADVGAIADVTVQSFAGNSYPFMELGAYGRWVTTDMRITAGAGAQWATSTESVDRLGLSLQARADVFLGGNITLTAAARSGLRSVTYRELIASNPYVSDSVTLDASYDLIDLRGTISFHPSVRTAINLSAALRQTDREPIWKGAPGSTFDVDYRTVRAAEISADAHVRVTEADVIGADVRIISATVVDNAVQPYIPSMRASLEYERNWLPSLSSVLGMVYVGQRYTDLENTKQLSGYADLRASVRYDISPTVRVQLRAENILASTVYVWDGYLERGAFVNLGLLWRFQ